MKVLIISHNSIDTYQNMGKTMLSLFSALKKEELCQLYIYPSVPDIDRCSSYYRITDKEVLASFYKFKVHSGEITPDCSNHQMFENENDRRVYRNPKNKGTLRRVGRDAIWKFSHWYNKSLKNWLEKQAPTHIFIAPGTAKCIYDMAIKISRDRKIPIVTYVCDDYYFVKPKDTFAARVVQKSFHKKIEKLMKKSTHIVTICKGLEDEYVAKFNVPATTIMTGSSYDVETQIKSFDNVTTLRYLGNISFNRFRSLMDIGYTLDEMNQEDGTNYSLEIFTGEKNQTILSAFDGIKSIKLCGHVSGDAFDNAFKSSEILVHTESFNEESIDLVKNSISTKIADSLASGIALFAYGPAQVASMRHLIDNDCAIVVTDKKLLKKGLKDAFSNKALRDEKANKALEAAFENHNSRVAGKKIRDIFERI